MLIQSFTVYLLALLSALYLLRGMMEIGATGWRGAAVLTVAVGVGILPALAAAATFDGVVWRWIVAVAAALGVLVNAGLMIKLWTGFTRVACLTSAISLIYAAILLLQLIGRPSAPSSIRAALF